MSPGPQRTDDDKSFLGTSRLHQSSLREHALRGFAWNSVARWGVRILSIVSTAALARLLTPYDFGLYAMAMIVVNFVEVFTQTGHLLALIRLENPSRAHFNTAWTLQVLIGFTLGLIIIGLAPIARRYFGVPEVESLLYFISLRTMIGGLANVGVVAFRINLDYAKDCHLNLIQKTLYVALCISLAATIKDYWALAFGVVGGNVIYVILTYVMHSYRPSLSLSKMKDLWSFSVLVLVGYVSEYTGRRLDELVVGGLVGPVEMGYYNAASDSAATPVADLMDPISRALYPLYARHTSNVDRLLRGYYNAFSAGATVAFASSIGLALVAKDFIYTLLGPQWLQATLLLQILALSGLGTGLVHGIPTLLNAIGRLGLGIAVVWLRIMIVLPALVVAGHYYGVIGVATAQVVVMVLMVPIWLCVLRLVIPLEIRPILNRLWRPVIASLAMSFAIYKINMILPPDPSVFRLIITVISGGAVFSVTQVLLWVLVGRPEGVEELLVSFFEGITRSIPRLRRSSS